MSNTAWSFSTLIIKNHPLISAISAEAIRNIAEFNMQGLGVTAWAFAKRDFHDHPLMEAISQRARMCEEFDHATAVRDGEEVQMAHALIFALWRSSLSFDAQVCVESWMHRGFIPDSTGLGLLFMDCEWRLDSRWATVLDLVMDEGTRAAIVGHMARPCQKHPIPLPIENASGLRPAGATRFRYFKLTLLVADVESQLGNDFSAFAVLRTVEAFAAQSERSWLKVAGDDKSYVLEAALRQEALQEHEVLLEFGCYVGYTTVRLAALLRRTVCGDNVPMSCARAWHLNMPVVSLERDAIHATIARHMLNLAQLRQSAEVVVGLLPMVTPRAVEAFGGHSLGFAFWTTRVPASTKILQTYAS